ncbi:MAG UNVERIFIED_CONTAM: hypothetical protein LVT10_22970, partial [Anaerolineae bacterium]|jgi:N-methylhydantoinase A
VLLVSGYILIVAPKMRVSLSSEVVAEIREYERASTTIANVYVQQLVEKYLGLLRSAFSTSRIRR